MADYLKQLYALLGPDRRKLPFLFLVFVVVSLFDLVGISLLGPYVALLVSPDTWTTISHHAPAWLEIDSYRSTVIALGLFLLGIFLVKAVVLTGANVLIVRFSQNQQCRLRGELLRAFQAMPYLAFLEKSKGERANSIIIGASHYSQLVFELLRLASDGIVAILLFALLLWTNALAVVVLLVLLIIPIWAYDALVNRRLRHLGAASERTIGRIIDLVGEAMEGFKEVRTLNLETFFSTQTHQASVTHADSQVGITRIRLVARHILEVVLVAFVVLLTVGLIGLGYTPAEALPTFGIFCGAAIRLLPVAKHCSETLGHLWSYRTVIQTLHSDIQNTTASDLKTTVNFQSSAAPDRPFKRLEFKDVDFRYPGMSQLVLKKANFTLQAGEAVGIVGRSGMGKTTLLDLLLGLISPVAGTVNITDETGNSSAPRWFGRATYLPQDALLINDTLERNITLQLDSDTNGAHRLHQALTRAQLGDLIAGLPQGLQTRLGAHGVRLSGGQRQRLALARALYHQREVLVLDEITAALDEATEREVFAEIAKLKGRVTIIVVAHDHSLLAFCDRIYQVENGRLEPVTDEPPAAAVTA